MTGPLVASERLTVKARLRVPLSPSFTVASAMVMRGTITSSVRMVPTAAPSARVAPLGEERFSARLSLSSATLSPLIVTLTVFCVSPAAKVIVPDLAT